MHNRAAENHESETRFRQNRGIVSGVSFNRWRSRGTAVVGVLFAALAVAQERDGSDETAISPGAGIASITIVRDNVFDLTDPKESGAFYEFFNRFHIVTRENIVEQQLLFAEGEPFDGRLLEETERILRQNRYLYDASVTARADDEGNAHVNVRTRDLWSITPALSVSRKGGENETLVGIEEDNLLGLGQRVRVLRIDDVDRRSTVFEYSDRQLAGSWTGIHLIAADNSDGNNGLLSIVKPFHALDARRAAGGWALDNDRETSLYSLGEEIAEYRHERRNYSAWGGLSAGLRDGWARRWTAGVVYDDNRFSDVRSPALPQVLPEDRKLVYPYLGFELVEDEYQKSRNSNQIDRSEDFYMGTRITASLGWSDEAFGADRDAWIYTLAANKGFGSMDSQALLAALNVHGRLENGDSANASSTLDLRYYWRQSEKRLFFVLLDATVGHNLDLDNPIQLGGDSGLRGYPLRYQSGDGRVLLTIEQRYFTDWYPFRLFRVGGAVFVDVGRTFGDNPVAGPNLGWLRDAGVGLRFAPTRLGGNRIVHLDLAFPLDGDASIDSVQILLEAKRSF